MIFDSELTSYISSFADSLIEKVIMNFNPEARANATQNNKCAESLIRMSTVPNIILEQDASFDDTVDAESRGTDDSEVQDIILEDQFEQSCEEVNQEEAKCMAINFSKINKMEGCSPSMSMGKGVSTTGSVQQKNASQNEVDDAESEFGESLDLLHDEVVPPSDLVFL